MKLKGLSITVGVVAFFLCAGASFVRASSYSDAVTGEGTLLYYWPMNESAGATALSPLTGGININLTGSTAGVAGQVGTAVSFNGTTDYGATASSLSLSTRNKVVMEAIMNYPATDSSDHVTWEYSTNTNSSTGGFFGGPISTGQFLAFHKGDSNIDNGLYTMPTADSWHHIVVVYDKGAASGQEISMYIDGTLQSKTTSLTANNTNNFGNNVLYIMSRAGSSVFGQGKMQHLAVYSDLSQSRITAHYDLTGIGVPSTTYTVTAGDLWDNGYDNVSAPRQSPFSRFVFTTNAASVNILGISSIYPSYPAYSQLGVRVNGVDQSPFTMSSAGAETFTLSLGSAGTTRTVEIIPGLQSKPSSTVLGTFINSVTYPNSATFSVTASTTQTDRILIYGDSIAVGGNATHPASESYVPLLRNTYGRSVMVEGWGWRKLYDDAVDGSARTTFTSRIASYNPATIYIAIGTNDYGFNTWTASAFGTAYAALLDSLHASMPSARIVCQTPIVRSSETANGNGSTLGDYRTQIATACNARSWTILVDGTALLGTGDLDDGVHPTSAGFTKYARAVNDVFSVVPTVTVSSASSVTATTATLNGSITAVGSTTPTVRGFAYGTTVSYGIATTTASGSFSTGAYTASISSLTCNTTYHVRAYATNFAGTGYSSDGTFTTSPCIPTVTTSDPSSVTASSMVLNGSISSTGGANATESGFAYGTVANLATVIATTTLGAQTGTASFSSSISGLSASTAYYFRAYATNSAGTAYGSIVSSTTSAVVVVSSDSSASTVTTTASGRSSLGARSRRTAAASGAVSTASTRTVGTVGSAVSSGTASGSVPSRNLSPGTRDTNVLELQKYLNSHGFAIVDKGPGSPGNETAYFGALTKAALIKFQEAHRNEILAPSGLTKGTGYFGPSTRAFMLK